MSRYQPRIPPQIAELMAHLPPAVKRDARQALRILAENPHAGEPLQRELRGLWKYRIRRFRIVYRIVPDERALHIEAIGPRANIYDMVRSFYRSA